MPPRQARGQPLHPIYALELVVVDARPGRYDQAFADLRARRAEALFAGGSAIYVRDQAALIALAAQHRLPAIWEWRQMAEGGGLLSYGANNASLHQRVAFYLDRVLKGAKVEQPGVFELVVNLKTAEVLKLRIPASVLTRADHVIE